MHTSALGGQKKVLYPLRLEIQQVVSLIYMGVGIEPWFGKVFSVLSGWAISSGPWQTLLIQIDLSIKILKDIPITWVNIRSLTSAFLYNHTSKLFQLCTPAADGVLINSQDSSFFCDALNKKKKFLKNYIPSSIFRSR